MGDSKRRRQATRSEKRGAILKRRFGDAPLDLHLFPLTAIQPPRSPADLPLAMWRLQVGVETLELQKRGALYCVACDGAIVGDLPPLVGFIRSDDPNSDLCGFAVCESCSHAAETREQLTAMISEAVGGVVAPVPRYN
jgi:hypothetical protein